MAKQMTILASHIEARKKKKETCSSVLPAGLTPHQSTLFAVPAQEESFNTQQTRNL